MRSIKQNQRKSKEKMKMLRKDFGGYLEFVQKIQEADAEKTKKTLRRTYTDVCR